MASWKEKGEVPDSDDEDLSDSQSTANDEERCTEPESGYDDGIGSQVVESEGRLEQFKEDDHESHVTTKGLSDGRGEGLHMSPTSLDVIIKPLQTSQDARSGSLSPVRIPQALLQLDGYLGRNEPETSPSEQTPSPQSSPELPTIEEISKSYVRLSSPMSSVLSSPPASPSFFSPLKGNDGTQASPQLEEHSAQTVRMADRETLSELQEKSYLNVPRNLRERKFKQQHPYEFERRRHANEFLSHGLKPIKLSGGSSPIRDTRKGRQRHESGTQDSDSPEGDYSPAVDTEMVDNTQIRESELRSTSPSPNNAYMHENGPTEDSNNSDLEMDDEDSFPSINEIARWRMKSGWKSRLNTYSSKEKHLKLPRIRTQARKSPSISGANDVFEQPNSPSETSSPFPMSKTKRPRVSTPLAAAISPIESTLSWLDPDELQTHPIGIPTPAMSSSRLVSDAILLDSDTDEDDPFAKQAAIALSSSSDESLEIRKVRKKIRGVLPASHLRFDQQQRTSSTPRHEDRLSLSLSPVKFVPRRGVAIPKVPGSRSSGVTMSHRIQYLSDNDSEDDVMAVQEIGAPENVPHSAESLGQIDPGSAEEDDTIDAMLPSRKRSRQSSGPTQKRRRTVSNSIFGRGGNSHQPKITDHITSRKPSRSVTSNALSRNKVHSSRVTAKNGPRNRKTVAAPRLSILDIVDTNSDSLKALPTFLRIAARTAKAKKGLGRQSPSRKFIRLDNREDTAIPHAVLQDWREGTIPPKELGTMFGAQNRNSFHPQHSLKNRNQDRTQSPEGNSTLGRDVVQPRKSRQLAIVSRTKQMSMSNFVSPRAAPHHSERRHEVSKRASNTRAQLRYPTARPAQLETLVDEYDNGYQTAAFRTSKKALDALYRAHRKRPVEQANMPLRRFLADDDLVVPAAQSRHSEEQGSFGGNESIIDDSALPKSRQRSKKRQPTRLDASAAIYRQPSEPLISDYLVAPQPEAEGVGTKLRGLPKFGTSISNNFDIFPLQSGIFFHESTFLGSGRLSSALKFSGTLDLQNSRSMSSLRLCDKDFQWGPWNENVSSEIGVCFDWLLEQLNIPEVPSLDLPPPDLPAIVTSVIDYIQHSLSFTARQQQEEFISRMSEVFLDCLARLKSSTSTQKWRASVTIDVLARTTILIFQVMRLSQGSSTQDRTRQLESQLVEMGSITMRMLLSIGLEGLRKLYDDLQYLSVRERGIRNDQVTAQAWVVLMKVFETAKIPRGSFWDLVSTQLIGSNITSLDDACAMEKIWYSMFSLLPLHEFDNFGVAIPGRRHKSSWEAWAIPQKLLKRIFSLYTSNPRQSPGFNDYCRTLVSRCYYLMLEWGWWKCSGIIGTVFDFFASQKLAHLRNEEVYKSPRFLEELDRDPSLAIDPEDRCFHILLKTIALALKHMRQADDTKGIRNLIARVLPNHDRQYPKEQAVHHRELASLRNHHDILSTLFWAAPPDLRPPLALIQELVAADRSHKEACLINLRAWANLARFVLSQTPASLLTETYQPLRVWQSTHFTKLLEQYSDASSELRKQVDLLPEETRGGISETQMQATTLANQSMTISTIKAYCDAMDSIYRSLPWTSKPTLTLLDVTTPTNLETFVKLFEIHTPTFAKGNADMISYGVSFLSRFLSCLSVVDPEKSHSTLITPEEVDSQDFGTLDVDVADYDFDEQALQPLRNIILPAFQKVVNKALRSNEYQSSTMREMIQTWASLLSLLIRKQILEPSDVLLAGPIAVFADVCGSSFKGKQSSIASVHWPLFLGELVRQTHSVFPNITRRIANFKDPISFNLGLEWMLAISKPLEGQHYEHSLTAALYAQSFFLLQGLDLRGWSVEDVEKTVGNPDLNLLCIRLAINNMSRVLNDSAMRATTHGGRSLHQVKEEFAHVLRRVMKDMEAELKRLNSSHDATHKAYVKFVQEVAKQIRSHGKDILPLPDFFVHESTDFWPDQSDPGYQLANLKAYTVRLAKGDSGAKWETFHYLFNSFKKAMLESHLESYIEKVTKAAKAWSFFEFMIECMIPAAIIVGFSGDISQNAVAWTLCVAWIPTIGLSHGRYTSYEHYIGDQESDVGRQRAESTFNSAISILYLIMDGLRKHFQRYNNADVHPSCERMVSLVCKLGDFLLPEIMAYIESHPKKDSPVISMFRKFMSDSCVYLEQPNSIPGYPYIDEIEPKSTADVSGFVKAIEGDMQQWTVLSCLPIGTYDDLRRTGQCVRIPVHGNSKEVDLEGVGKNLWTFSQVLQHAGPFTMLESQTRSRVGSSSTYNPWIMDDVGNKMPNTERKPAYHDTARLRVLRDMPPF